MTESNYFSVTIRPHIQASICRRCGVVVWSVIIHDEWHESLTPEPGEPG